MGQASLGLNNQMRLPRVRSISASRQWDNVAAAEPSFSSTAPTSRIHGRTARTHNAVGGRSGSQGGIPQKNYNAGRQFPRSGIGIGRSIPTSEEGGNPLPTRRLPSAGQYQRGACADRGMADAAAGETSQRDVSRRVLSESMQYVKETTPKSDEVNGTGKTRDDDRHEQFSTDAAVKVVNRSVEGGSNQLTKKLSLASDDAMRRLGELDVQLGIIEEGVARIDQARSSGKITTEDVGQTKMKLAQLEADAHKLETQGVDGIYTSSLVSGLTSAKQLKKGQLQRLEVLFQLIEDIFRYLKQPTSDS